MVSGKFEEQTSEVEGGGGEGERAWGGKVGDGESEMPEAREPLALGSLPLNSGLRLPSSSPLPPPYLPAQGSCLWESGNQQAGGTGCVELKSPTSPHMRVPEKKAIKQLNQVCVCVAGNSLGAHPAAGGVRD